MRPAGSVQGNTAREFAQIDHAVKAKGWLLIEVVTPDSSVSFPDGGFKLLEITVKQIHFTYIVVDPCAAVYPWPPFVEIGDLDSQPGSRRTSGQLRVYR